MAVGCSRETVVTLMEELGSEATVACVNSPSSVTLSGDPAKLEAIRKVLDQRDIFVRRLKVDVAYHSPQMQRCSMDYYACISDFGQNETAREDHSQQTSMISSVTGNTVYAEDLGPYYWVQNLMAPLLFAEAVKDMVAPAEKGGERAIDLMIEVGPHSALHGPIEQTLSYYGINEVTYASMLVRGQDALKTSIGLAAEVSLVRNNQQPMRMSTSGEALYVSKTNSGSATINSGEKLFILPQV